MHLNFAFNQVQILWTLTFAAHLVLLVVLLGRDRAGRFPWFTTAIALVALRLVSSRLLYGRLPELTLGAVFIVLADLSAIAGLMVLVEVARRAFARADRKAWALATFVLLGLGASVLAAWGQWPQLKQVIPNSPLALLGLMQLIAQKTGLLVDVLTILLGLLVVAFGRRFGAGWRSHAQQIIIGLSTASIAQLGVQVVWQIIAKHSVPKSMDDYQRLMGLKDKLVNANSAIYLAAAIWWIVCLWIDEQGATMATREIAIAEPVTSVNSDAAASSSEPVPE
jgi:hypothetical protein